MDFMSFITEIIKSAKSEFWSTPIKTASAIISVIGASLTLVLGAFKIKPFIENQIKSSIKNIKLRLSNNSPDLKPPPDVKKDKESPKETRSLAELIQDMSLATRELSKSRDYSDFQEWFVLNFSDPIKREIERTTGEKPEIEDEKDMFKWFPVRYIIKHLKSNTLMELLVCYEGNIISSNVIRRWSSGNNDYSCISFKFDDGKEFSTKEELINFIVDRDKKYNNLS